MPRKGNVNSFFTSNVNLVGRLYAELSTYYAQIFLQISSLSQNKNISKFDMQTELEKHINIYEKDSKLRKKQIRTLYGWFTI